MVWDLGKAMHKKEEFESARLLDFEFRQRARATRLLARALNIDETALIGEIAHHDEAGLLALAAERAAASLDEVSAEFGRCLVQARSELIAERGDPTPYRLG